LRPVEIVTGAGVVEPGKKGEGALGRGEESKLTGRGFDILNLYRFHLPVIKLKKIFFAELGVPPLKALADDILKLESNLSVAPA
jgi:hypothetical protein